MIQDADNSNWYKLSPDAQGNYVDGKWTQLASTPGWGPLYFASQVMTDGRVFAMGGEYNFGDAVWINTGGIYDPVKDAWTPLAAPSGWNQIGDMGSLNLPTGQVIFANPFSSQFGIFDPTTNQITAPYGSGKAEANDEEGLTLLPNGNIFTVDVGIANGAEVFDTTSKTWSKLPNTPYDVVDRPDAEIGPAVLQYNGQIIQFGGNGANVIFNPSNSSWSSAPSFPKVSAGQLDCADAPAVLLPNGQVLVDAGPGYAIGGCYFFLWDGTKGSLTAVQGPPDSPNSVDFAGNFLILPNGQILYTNQSPNVMLYTPSGSPDPTWAPTITNAPSALKIGSSYTISGTQFNGLSGGSAYGDDQQNQTNYPIIKLTMQSSGHVLYCREYGPSTMGICTGSKIVSTHFTVPSNAELGAATLQVVTNGIASKAVNVSVVPPISASSVSLYQGINGSGTVASINTVDGICYKGTSVNSSSGQIVAVEADFKLPITKLQTLSIKATAAARSGATEQVYAYDWVRKTWVIFGSVAFGSGQTTINVSVPSTSNPANFCSSTGQVKTLVRGVLPSHISISPYQIKVDAVALAFG